MSTPHSRLSAWQHQEGVPAPGGHVCPVSALDATGAKGIDFENEDGWCSIFLVADRDSGVHAYVNQCPHAGTPLEILPDRFLTRNRDAIICTTHGARFRITDGLCIAGPCRGQSLSRIPVTITGTNVRIDPPPGRP